MIDVKHIQDTEYEITWDESDPLESQLNTWTEQDFVKAIQDFLDSISE